MFNPNLSSARRLTQAAAALSAFAVLGVGVAVACHPQGTITKDVQNLTTGSAVSAADTTATAVVAHPGDTLVYTVSVSNTATGKDDQLITTKITDALPAGLSLVKEDSFNLGTVTMKQTVKRTITVKVTATTAGVIKNTACFTGDSSDHKVPQNGCDAAYIKVVVPAATPTPTPTATPKPTVTPTATPTPTIVPTATPTPGQGQGEVLSTSTTALPAVGGENASAALGLTAMISTAVAYIRSRRRK